MFSQNNQFKCATQTANSVDFALETTNIFYNSLGSGEVTTTLLPQISYGTRDWVQTKFLNKQSSALFSEFTYVFSHRSSYYIPFGCSV